MRCNRRQPNRHVILSNMPHEAHDQYRCSRNCRWQGARGETETANGRVCQRSASERLSGSLAVTWGALLS
jgi:hypothetical protein